MAGPGGMVAKGGRTWGHGGNAGSGFKGGGCQAAGAESWSSPVAHQGGAASGRTKEGLAGVMALSTKIKPLYSI